MGLAAGLEDPSGSWELADALASWEPQRVRAALAGKPDCWRALESWCEKPDNFDYSAPLGKTIFGWAHRLGMSASSLAQALSMAPGQCGMPALIFTKAVTNSPRQEESRSECWRLLLETGYGRGAGERQAQIRLESARLAKAQSMPLAALASLEAFGSECCDIAGPVLLRCFVGLPESRADLAKRAFSLPQCAKWLPVLGAEAVAQADMQAARLVCGILGCKIPDLPSGPYSGRTAAAAFLSGLDRLAGIGGLEKSLPLIGQAAQLGMDFSPKASGGRASADRMRSPFYYAARKSCDDRAYALYLDALVAAGADPGEDGYAAAELAVCQKGLGRLSELVKRGYPAQKDAGMLYGALGRYRAPPDTKAENYMGLARLGVDPAGIPAMGPCSEHPVASALESGDARFAVWVLKQGSAPAWTCSEPGKEGMTAAHMLAADGGWVVGKSIADLVESGAAGDLGARMSAPRQKGVTPLMVACQKLNLPAIRAFLAAGADPNARDDYGQSALHHAGKRYAADARSASAAAIEALLDAGADPAAKNNKGQTAAQQMSARAPLESVLRLLRLNPMDVGGDGETAKAALANLEKRGQSAASQAQQIAFEGLCQSQAKGQDAGAPAPKRRSL